MSSGGGSGSTPNTPNSTTLPPISPIVPFLHQSAAGGLRYPLYTVQGAPLVYSPTMFGMPWRPIAPMQGTSTSSSSVSSVTSVPNPAVTGLTQVPSGGLVYPIGLPMLQASVKPKVLTQGESKKMPDIGESLKRRVEMVSAESSEAKRPRLSESIPPSPSLTSSPSSHPSTPPHTHKASVEQWRSPVIRIAPGQTVILPTNTSNPRASMTPQAIVLPAASIKSMSPNLPKAIIPKPLQPHRHSSRVHDSGPPASNEATPKILLASSQLSPPSLPDKISLVLFKCLGKIPDSVLSHPNITVSSHLQDLYKQPHYAAQSHEPLSSDTACSLTIHYLNSLRPGESINTESLRTMIHYAQVGEAEYNHKRKNVPKSTHFQSQLMHLSRMAVYPSQGRVLVRTSHHSLGEGLVHSLCHLQLLINNGQPLPEYVVVMSVHPPVVVDFCVLVIEPLQVVCLREAELMELKRKRPQTKPKMTVAMQPTKLSLSGHVISHMQRYKRSLKGKVHTPFHCHGESLPDRIDASKAQALTPASSHVIEHKPSGPFQDQCSIAMAMLQKILSSFNSETKLEHFKNIDFRVICPPDASFVAQTVSDILCSGLIEQLESSSFNQSPSRTSGSPSSPDSVPHLDVEAEARSRVVCCNLAPDATRFKNLLSHINTNKETLFLVIVENAHLTTKIAYRSFPSARAMADTEHSFVLISDCMSLLSNFSNCVFLNVSSHPYSLQTNHSLVSPMGNQIHWPTKQPLTSEERNGSQFCSIDTFQLGSPEEKQAHFGVSFREDVCFEEAFHKATASLNQSSLLSTSVASVRAQLLLEQYVLSLLATVGQPPPISCGSPQPETLNLVSQLVKTPLSNRRGQGTMLIIRSHNIAIGHQLYHVIKSTRDSLGLQYRFEVLFDDGTHLLTLSDHFARRIPQRRGEGHATCYKDLEGIPCLVVLAGQARAGLSFPRSLRAVDLRLCYPIVPSLTRSVYEYDMSLLNGHYTPLKEVHSGRQKDESEEEPMKTTPTEESDSVFEVNTSPLNRANGPMVLQRTSSSSSSRKSSFCEDPKQAKTESTLVSWHPTHGNRTSRSSTSSAESHSVPKSEVLSPNRQQECVLSPSGTVTVTIDPPSDDNQFYSGSDLHRIPFTARPVEDTVEWNDDSKEWESDSEEEDEDDDLLSSNRVCLLSRSYYHVWSSRNKQQYLLLPPAPGVSWCGGHKRPPLFDPDPQTQSLHYFKWSRPASSHDRAHLESVSKGTTQGSGRRLLLTGPPQVGKTGAWQLLVRLLHDRLLSCKGVVIETGSPTYSVFLQDTSSGHRTNLSSKHSKIVTLEYLASHLCNGVDSKEMQSPRTPTSGMKPHTTLSLPVSTASISTTPSMAYDASHSCNDCAQVKQSTGQSLVAVSNLPTRDDSSLTLRWHIPATQAKHCSLSTRDGETQLDMLKLPFINRHREFKPMVRTPVFIPSLGRDLTGLFNLVHTGYQQLQVLVTVESQFERYCKAWPNLIIMALPDNLAVGLGSTYHLIKSFMQHNYLLNTQNDSSTHTTWPMVAIMSDNIVMWKRVTEGRADSITMSEALLDLENSTECLQYTAISVLPWSENLTKSGSLTDFDLSHDFIVLNLAHTADLQYNQFSFNSADAGFNLALRAAGVRTKLHRELAIVKKHIPTGGNMYPLQSSLCSDLDRVVISLHHDSSSHLPYPGPYLMEYYLLHKSHSLFPHALHPSHPVLVIDNYITLGPKMHVTMVNSNSLVSAGSEKGLYSRIQSGDERIRFGGLLLYLCEGKLESEQINKLCFVPGACLCLVTRDCKTLVQEVARLDLEEKWKFRLRDEYQTACSDKMKPLFFLIGRYEG